MTSHRILCASLRAIPPVLLAIAACTRPLPAADAPGPAGRKTIILSESINRFGADLYQKTEPAENLVFSPSSLSTVMALVYAGARKETAEEIGAALHFPVPPEQLHLVFAALRREQKKTYSFGVRAESNNGYGLRVTEVLSDSSAAGAGLKPKDLILTLNGQPVRNEETYAQLIDASQGKLAVQWFRFEEGTIGSDMVRLVETSPQLEIVNAVWGQKGVRFKPAYLEQIRQSYQASFNEVDFQGRADDARRTINAWVAQQTHNRIKDLLSAEAVTRECRLVLTNTLYLKAEWLKPFAPEKKDLPWKPLAGGAARPVAAMSRTDTFPHVETSAFDAVEFPYRDSELSLVVLLPKLEVPWKEFLKAVQTRPLPDDWTKLQPARVRVVLPKFRIETKLALQDYLAPMMPRAFSKKADFSGLCDEDELHLSTVAHMAFIAVDERGTEAGAAAGATATIKGPADVAFVVDRPFAYLLRDRASNTVLFQGHVTQPHP